MIGSIVNDLNNAVRNLEILDKRIVAENNTKDTKNHLRKQFHKIKASSAEIP